MTEIHKSWPKRSAAVDLFDLLVRSRFWLLLVGHSIVFIFSFALAYFIRFDFRLPPQQVEQVLYSLPWILATKIVCFYLFRSFHGWWRYVSFSDLKALGKASVVSALALVTLDYLTRLKIPPSILTIDTLITFLAIGSVRSSWRMMHEEILPFFRRGPRTNAVLVGASEASWRLAHQLRSVPHLGYNVIGIVYTSNCDKYGGAGLPVLGDIDSLKQVLAYHKVDEVLVPAGEIAGECMRKIAECCKSGQPRLRIIPKIEHVIHGSSKLLLRDVEINDLLRRDPVVLDNDSITAIVHEQVVLVTGAGGSIGSEICRQVIEFSPKKLILVGRGENRIFAIEQELRNSCESIEIVPVIADVGDSQRMQDVFNRFKPDVVFHAAAHKHVPLMELNVGEAVKNNILGTKTVADCAMSSGVAKFVLISTDKAVNPTSVMGATKHLAERYVLSRNDLEKTKFIVVRFGNVLGSNGSVIPTFQEQIRRGGPITVTDPRMKRYFMSIPEASQLVLQAAAQGNGGEIFVLNMGEPVAIVDLAKDLIRLSGLDPEAIDIEFTGIRPGEKLFEELYFDEEHALPTSHPKIMAAYHRHFPVSDVNDLMNVLAAGVDQCMTSDSFLTIFSDAISEFRHNSPYGTATQQADLTAVATT